MEKNEITVSRSAGVVLAAIFVVALVHLCVKLHRVQVEGVAEYNYALERQAVRKVQTCGLRGSILDCKGRMLAENTMTRVILCDPAGFQRKSWDGVVEAIRAEINRLSHVIGRRDVPSESAVRRHVKQRLFRPMKIWDGLSQDETDRFFEHEREFPGFRCESVAVRHYPYGSLAAHALGYVRAGEARVGSTGEKFDAFDIEMVGKTGLEGFYNDYLAGVHGENHIIVDARCFAIRELVVVKPQAGLNLKTTIDIDIQRAVERQLCGERGACVVMDPRDGAILAFASSPTYDLNNCIPTLSAEVYLSLTNSAALPLLNRASGGVYAPGSTFKPITALAGLRAGVPEDTTYSCDGAFRMAGMRLRCARVWGHGSLDLRHALMKSCNPFFCNLGMEAGTNKLLQTASDFGLGEKTGIDIGVDMAGIVPDAVWIRKVYNKEWQSGDLAHMSIGQGMLLVTPLQMARVAGALGVGYLTVPHFNAECNGARRSLPFTEQQLNVIREGMWLVVNGRDDIGMLTGSGRRAGDGVAVSVSGKTGTAEVGAKEHRRKNTWFIAFAPSTNPTVALAIVIEDGQSGGETAAPKAAEILKAIFGSSPSADHTERIET